MRRHTISRQPERVLEISEEDTKLDLSKPEENEDEKENEILKEIPPKELFNYNLKKLKSFKKIRSNYKIKNMKYIFVSDLQLILNEYKPSNNENDLNDELLLEILNIAEEYFIYPLNKDEREQTKKECIAKLMLPYFRNDEVLLDKTINHIFHKVKKSTVLKRCYQRFKRFFFQK